MTTPDEEAPDRGALPSAQKIQDRQADDRRRQTQNLAALAFIVALLVLGAWLIDRLAAYNRNMACLTSHARNCGK